MPAPNSKIHVHVFDVDGPIYSRDTDEDFALYLGKRGRFSAAGNQLFAQIVEDYKAKRIDYRTLAQKAVDAFALGIKDMPADRLYDDALTFTKANQKYFHPKAIAMLRQLKKNPNVRIALLSTSPNLAISMIGRALGLKIDHVYGAEYATANMRYTGKPRTGDLVNYKAQKLRTLARFFKVPIKQLTFYGNAVTDYQSSKKARVKFVMMNPAQALKDAVKRDRQWQEAGARRLKRPARSFLRRQQPVWTRPKNWKRPK